MSIDTIVLSATGSETRAAMMRNDSLVELMIEREGLQTLVGNIYMGRVCKVAPGIQAVFVDIGLEKPGLLALTESRPLPGSQITAPAGHNISDHFNEGMQVLVQVMRDPIDGKGAKLTVRPDFPGYHLIYMPGQTGARVSRRIDDEKERGRLAGILKSLPDDGNGFIARTAAINGDAATMINEAADLSSEWLSIVERSNKARVPACIYQAPGFARRVISRFISPSLKQIIVDAPALLEQLQDDLQAYAPELAVRLTRHKTQDDLFQSFGINGQIEDALLPGVMLPSGGSVIFEETAATVAIDVNTGVGAGGPEETALRTNLEAVREIARGLRLRNLSGLIVVDFVRMKNRKNGNKVLAAFRKAVSDDPARVQVVGFTSLGLAELTRRRLQPSLSRQLSSPCPVCDATGRVLSPETVAFESLRAALRQTQSAPFAAISITACPGVIEVLQNGSAQSARQSAERRTGRPINLIPDQTCQQNVYEITMAPPTNEMNKDKTENG